MKNILFALLLLPSIAFSQDDMYGPNDRPTKKKAKQNAISAKSQQKEDLLQMRDELEANVNDLQKQISSIDNKLGWPQSPSSTMNDDAGEYLQKAANYQLIGVSMMALGGFIGGGIISSDPTTGAAIMGLGGVAGIALNIVGWIQVQKAGRAMSGDRVAFSGRGLTINLNP